MSNRNAVIKGTETWVLRSDLTGKEHLISLGLPHLYPDEPEKKWPVVYLIDANYYFGMVTDIVRSMSWCGMTQDAIVVGIGYVAEARLEEAWHDVMVMRDHDLTPGQDEVYEKEWSENRKREVRTGGADKFLEFIDSELIGLVESKYRVDENERTLAGHSFGGLFALFAMLQKPELFRNYVACSPSTDYKEQIIFEYEERYAKRRKTMPARLFLSMGDLEKFPEYDHVEGMNRFFSQVESRRYKQLEIEKKGFPGEDHCTVIAPSFQAGLKMALRS